LIGLATHPNFAQHPLLYSYTSETNGPTADFPIPMPSGNTNDHQQVIAEWRIDPTNRNRVDPKSRREVLRLDKPQSNHNGGVMAAERMATILPKGGKIAVLGTIPGSVSTTERENGFRETIAAKAPLVKIVEFQYGMSDRAKSLAVAEDIMTAHPDLDAIFCSNESGTIGAIQAAKSKGVAGKLKIVGFDSSPTMIEDMQAGNLDSLVVQNPFRMGYAAVKALVDKLNGKTPERRIDTGATVVTAANMKEPAVQELLSPPIEKYLK